MERYEQTTLSFNRASGNVTIINPIHPLHGQSVTVRSIRQLGKSVKVTVEHPQGGLLSLPASQTSLDPPQPSFQVKGQTPLFDPKKLLRLAQWVGTQNTAATSSLTSALGEIDSGQQPEKVVQKKFNATTTKTTQSPSRPNRRTHQALNHCTFAHF